MGIFGGLDKDAYDRQYSDAYLFRRLGNYLGQQKRNAAIVTGMGMVVSIAQALMPIIIAAGVDALERGAASRTLALLVGGLLVVNLVQYFGNWLRRRSTNRLVATITAQMRKDAFAAAIGRDMAFYDANKTGKVLSRITGDTEDFGQIMVVTLDIISPG